MLTALILGITGQDGLYLAEFLSRNNYRIIGVTRDAANAAARIPQPLLPLVRLEEWDMIDQSRITDLFKEHQPAEAYNCASISTGVGMYEDPVGIGVTNGIAVTRVLEAVRTTRCGTRFCQASSSEMFGEPETSPQSEATTFKPRSPYGAAKLYAHAMVDVYRRTHAVHACSAILFNHESPRRPQHFVSRKVSMAAARIKLGMSSELRLGNLTAQRDWGFAGDYVRAMWMMLQHPTADDYVVATGIGHSVHELCDIAFSHVALDYRKYVTNETASFRPNERVQLIGNADKARATLGWKPSLAFNDLIRMMVDADIERLRHGTNVSN